MQPLIDGARTVRDIMDATGLTDFEVCRALFGLLSAGRLRRVATAAQIRLIHGSTLAGNVDIYVTANSDISTASPAFNNVPFKAETGYVSLTPGSYVVTVTPTGTKTAAIGPLRLELAGNKIYTAVARDGAGRAAPLGLIVLDDFNQYVFVEKNYRQQKARFAAAFRAFKFIHN